MARNHPKRRNAPQGDTTRPNRGKNTAKSASHSHNEDGPVWLWGTHAVQAALENPARKCLNLLASENAAKKLTESPITPETVSMKDLDHRLPPGAVHQGIAAQFEQLETLTIEDVIDRGITRIVVLDQVSDPHNLGAIYRSAAAFGFDAIVLQTRNAPPITGVVAKAAAGAIEMIAESRVVNVARALDSLNEAGFHTVGLDGGGKVTLSQAFKGATKLAIVMGAEGPGLRPGVAKACSELAHIPISSQMESLNVSTAASIAFYEASVGTKPSG